MDAHSLSMAVRKRLIELSLNRPDSTDITAISRDGVVVSMPEAVVEITPQHLRVKARNEFIGHWDSVLRNPQFPGYEILVSSLHRHDPLITAGFGPETGEWSSIEMPPELFDIVWFSLESLKRRERRQQP